jgi:hypothetical protein
LVGGVRDFFPQVVSVGAVVEIRRCARRSHWKCHWRGVDPNLGLLYGIVKEMEVSTIAAMKHSEVSASCEQGGHVQRAHVTDADPPDRFGSNNDHIDRHVSGRKKE